MVTRAAAPARPQRPREMQDPLNFHLYHPLSWQLARRLARTPITPNMVSVIGGMFVVAAGFSYWGLPWPYGACLGMVLHMTWHVVDGADGDLARVTGKCSPLGEMIDGICDYTSHIVLYVLLAFVLTRSIGPGWAWFWTLAAGASHIVQANHAEVQRRFYQYWIYGVPWLHNARGDQPTLFDEKRGAWRVFLQTIARFYLRLAAGMSPQTLGVNTAVTQAQGNPERLAAIRAEVRREQQPLLRLLMVLGPNPRAIILGLSMIAGSPIYYMVFYTIALNLLMFVSVKLHNAAAARVAARIA